MPTFITISFRGNEPLHAKGKNYFVLHMDGKTIDMDELNVDIQGCLVTYMWHGNSMWLRLVEFGERRELQLWLLESI